MKKIVCFIATLFLFFGFDTVYADEYHSCLTDCGKNCYQQQDVDACMDKCPDMCKYYCISICEDECLAQYTDDLDVDACMEKCPSNCPNKTQDTNKEEVNTDEINTYKKVQCGDLQIPYIVAQTTSMIITILKFIVPIIIVILGSLDLLKAVIAQKEDEIKKGQQIFIRRLIVGVFVFLVFALVQVVIGLVAPNNQENMWNCVNCFVNGDC